jgi:uncharacterized membrane protein YraQ (UPF0718 family)
VNLDLSIAILWGAVGLLALLTWYKHGPQGVREGLGGAWTLAKVVIRIVPFALLAAMILAQVIPQQVIAGLIGNETGLQGIVIASIAGGLVPSGPFLSFPLALSLYHTGAGLPQLISFITGWSVYATFRVIVWELPMMGPRFTMIRLSASAILPVVAGILAGVLYQIIGAAG